jgi:hypothetical protein
MTNQYLIKDYREIAKSTTVAKMVIKELNLKKISPDSLSKKVRVELRNDTRILEISVQNENPQLARKTADKISEIFIKKVAEMMNVSNINIVDPPEDPVEPVSPKPVFNTVVVFIILFLITSIHGYRLIYRFKLIELFKAQSQGERAPKTSVFLSLVSVLLIGGGYFIYTKSLSSFGIFAIFITLAFTVIGTFMLFSSLTLLINKLSKKNKRRYFKGINMIGTSQLLYRIKASARTLATIAV